MAVVHREDGGAAGMLGRRVVGAVEEQSTPVEACREGDGCEEEGCEEEGRREGGWGRSKGRGLFECRWKHQAPEKRLSGRFHFHSRLTSSNC